MSMTSDNLKYRILPAAKEDARFIAKAISIALHMGESDSAIDCTPRELEQWEEVFTSLAARDDSQYSYRNTLKAVDESGNILGMIIGYDGARLHELRERFFEEVERRLGENYRGMPDETSPDEWYLDTLAVWPAYRRHGIGGALLMAAARKAVEANKPAGLLVDKANVNGRALYEANGFRYVGDRPFAGVMMDHMQLNLNQ